MKNKITILLLALLFALIPFGISYAQKSSATVRIKFGDPKEGSSGWPTSGRITQGPLGSAGHAANNLVALDIANVPNTPIYATFDGIAYAYDCSNRGECNTIYGRLGNYVKLVPDSNPSAIVLFAHMNTVTVTNGTRVKIGDQLGLMGNTGYVLPPGGGYHLHYEFRGMPMAAPYIPETVTPSTCGEGGCTPDMVSSDGN